MALFNLDPPDDLESTDDDEDELDRLDAAIDAWKDGEL